MTGAMWIVDRFEGDTAVLQRTDTKALRDVPRSELPEGAREGSALRERDGRYELDESETRARAERIRRKLDDLWE